MNCYDVAVVGAGPAGLEAACTAAHYGARVCLIDRQHQIGGQLIKQTHKFFGSREQKAGTRGIHIAQKMAEEAACLPNIDIRLDTTALGFYPDRVLTLDQSGRYCKIKCTALTVCTGAQEKMLMFTNNDLPGVYGAGAVQTLMNVDGVRPGRRVLMVGAGNIGLIVSYQLLQAGVSVAAVVEASPRIGGYAVHASKIRRLGIPILTSHSIKQAYGRERVTGACVWRLDAHWRGISGTEEHIECDTICLAAGLSPLTELLWQAGCKMRYVPELGGHVPLTDLSLETSVGGVFVAGDASGIEEASAAMLTGRIAGLGVARYLGICADYGERFDECSMQIEELRRGPAAQKIIAGIRKLRGETT